MKTNKCEMSSENVDEKMSKFPNGDCNGCENYLEEDGTYICTKPLDFKGDE